MRQAGEVAVLGEVEHPAASLLDSSVCLVRGAMLGGPHVGKFPIEPAQVHERLCDQDPMAVHRAEVFGKPAKAQRQHPRGQIRRLARISREKGTV